MSGEETSPPRPRAKKLPFKPTALRKSASQKVETPADATNTDDDGLELFRRSKEMEPIMAADRERRMKKKQKQEEERRKSAESAKRQLEDEDQTGVEVDEVRHDSPQDARSGTPVNGESKDGNSTRFVSRVEGEICLFTLADGLQSELVTPPASKRTRLDTPPSRSNVENIDSVPDDSPSARLLRSHTMTTTTGNVHHPIIGAPNAEPISLLDSDDDDDDCMQITSIHTRQRDDSVEVLETSFAAQDDDDEFAEYIRKAEEQRARDKAMLSVGPDGAAAKDPIDVLVTSVVPGTKPCCFKFLFDKQLRVARNTWLSLQHHKGLLKEVQKEDDIILTWRRQKVYAFSTLLSLGIRPQGNGRAVVDGNSSNGLAGDRTRVHMEAWTLELFQEMEREEEQRRKREAGELPDDETSPQDDGEPPPPEVKIRVILKARDLEDVRLTVRPETTVETLVTGFRSQRSIGSDKDVGLWFDGDRLEEHVTMDEAEIDDMDTFEVHIK